MSYIQPQVKEITHNNNNKQRRHRAQDKASMPDEQNNVTKCLPKIN